MSIESIFNVLPVTTRASQDKRSRILIQGATGEVRTITVEELAQVIQAEIIADAQRWHATPELENE